MLEKVKGNRGKGQPIVIWMASISVLTVEDFKEQIGIRSFWRKSMWSVKFDIDFMGYNQSKPY